jgi:hypothetical protein
MTPPASSNICSHWAGVLTTIDKAWTGPANSLAKMALTRRCRDNGVVPSNAADTTTTLKCVSEPLGLWVRYSIDVHTRTW